MPFCKKRSLSKSAVRCAVWAATVCFAQEQYPKPLVHTPADHPAARVLLLSVDGLHAIDLANWVAAHPRSTLAELSARGDNFTNAHSPAANAVAGLMAAVTGGTPISTGILGADGYDRALSPPGSGCASTGARLDLKDEFDARGGFDPARAPLDLRNGCAPVAPHKLLRVNTIFEVVREKIGETAWAGEDSATVDLLRGPSGMGLSRACCDCSGGEGGSDEARLAALEHWIQGRDAEGSRFPVPVLFGMSFSSVAASQRTDGYVDAVGTPSKRLSDKLEFLDHSIGRLVTALKTQHLYDSTWIFIVSPFGQSPMAPRRKNLIPLARIRGVVDAARRDSVAHLSGGRTAMIWLRDPTEAASIAKALGDSATSLGIQDILFGRSLALTLNSPEKDSRMPDIILHADYGTVWAPDADASPDETGGALEEDTHVALLVSGSQLTGRTDPTWVPTTQLAPLLLRALGMEKFDLHALHLEHSPALPGIF